MDSSEVKNPGVAADAAVKTAVPPGLFAITLQGQVGTEKRAFPCHGRE